MREVYQKELNIFKRLIETNYEAFDPKGTMSVQERSEIALQWLTDKMDAMHTYSAAVATFGFSSELKQMVNNQELPASGESAEARLRAIIRKNEVAYRNATMSLSNVKAALNDLNVLSEKLGLEPYTTADLDNVREVNRVAEDFVRMTTAHGFEKFADAYDHNQTRQVVKANTMIRLDDIGRYSMSEYNPNNPNPEAIVQIPDADAIALPLPGEN